MPSSVTSVWVGVFSKALWVSRFSWNISPSAFCTGRSFFFGCSMGTDLVSE